MTARMPLRTVKAIWRDQVCADNGLRPAAFKIGYVMADYMTMAESAEEYRRTGKVIIWPSQESLHLRTELAHDTIRSSVAQLIERGHLRKLKRGNQFTGSNTYRIILRAGESN
ncbi:MAG: hypothetical protein WDM86_18825 [Rhizomicrobium sp.]